MLECLPVAYFRDLDATLAAWHETCLCPATVRAFWTPITVRNARPLVPRGRFNRLFRGERRL
jgi:hypothetical protein